MRDRPAPRKNARHQIRAVARRLLQIGWAGHPETKHISTHRIIWDTSAQAATLLARADKVVEYARSSPWPNLI